MKKHQTQQRPWKKMIQLFERKSKNMHYRFPKAMVGPGSLHRLIKQDGEYMLNFNLCCIEYIISYYRNNPDAYSYPMINRKKFSLYYALKLKCNQYGNTLKNDCG